jgi:phage-related protein
VAIRVDGREVATGSFNVAGDPDINISDADRRAWFDAVMQMHRLQKTMNEAAESVGQLNERIRSIQQSLKDTPAAADSIKAKVEELAKRFATVGRRFGIGAANPFEAGQFERINENLRFRIGGLKGGILSSTSRPTETQMRMISEARALLEKTVDEANALINSLPALYRELAEGGIYPAPVKPINK